MRSLASSNRIPCKHRYHPVAIRVCTIVCYAVTRGDLNIWCIGETTTCRPERRRQAGLRRSQKTLPPKYATLYVKFYGSALILRRAAPRRPPRKRHHAGPKQRNHQIRSLLLQRLLHRHLHRKMLYPRLLSLQRQGRLRFLQLRQRSQHPGNVQLISGTRWTLCLSLSTIASL